MAEKANIDELRKILGYFSLGYKVPKIIHDTIFEVAKREVEDKGKVVLIKRDPNIERGRIQAMRVKIIEDNAMEMHPAIVGKFGADFDGDTMGVFAPISEEAQQEAKDKMTTSVSNTTINDPMFDISKEALTGIYSITNADNKNQPVLITELKEAVNLHPGTIVKMNFKGKLRTTTAGRIVFNAILPGWFEYMDEVINNKKLNGIFSDIISRDREEFRITIDKVMKLGFEMATVYPRSISIDMLNVPEPIIKLKKQLHKEKDPVKQSAIITEMTKLLGIHLEANVPHLHEQIKSGAAKGVDQMRQIMVAKGLLTDSQGNLLPVIAKSMNDGYSPEEYFGASHASRKGVADRALATADGGYAYRKMVYVMSNTECDITNMDCGTRNTLPVKLTPEFLKRMGGRFCVVDKKIVPVSKEMVGKVINLRSPIFCRSESICRKCFGELIQQIQTRYCGIVAAQECTSLSEKIMKSFHTGGIISLDIPDMMPMLTENVEDSMVTVVSKLFKQDEFIMRSNFTPLIMKIDSNIYNGRYDISKEIINDDVITLPVGHFEFIAGDVSLPITIEKITKVFVSDKEINDGVVILTYGKGDPIFELDSKILTPQETARMIDQYIGGKSPWADPSALFTKFFKLLSPYGGWDTVHLEVIISAILRNKKDPQYPARVKHPYDPVAYSIKKLPGVMSWPLGIAFENMSAALTTGLISDRAPESAIEKVLFGEPLSKLGVEGLKENKKKKRR